MSLGFRMIRLRIMIISQTIEKSVVEIKIQSFMIMILIINDLVIDYENRCIPKNIRTVV